MGSQENLIFSNYMNSGEIPEFKIYDFSEQIVYDLIPSLALEPWQSNGYYIIDGNSNADIEQPKKDWK